MEAFRARLGTAPNSTLSKDTALKRLQCYMMEAPASLLSTIGASIEHIHMLVSVVIPLNGIFSRINLDVDCSVLSRIA